ncbi:hypothetical protein J3Q64DRAFT_1777678 [Phycomyces blakesleeanus]|uniref:Cns1/TTC4 wheel domain-containing protein n=1 Tax=Phycomyces blakesleeanus TaxID=4837 RepID=A0ABR3AHF7_PHYBL
MENVVGPKPHKSEFSMDPENLDRDLSNVPLFMTHLPEAENDTLSALQSLVYDGTPEEIAENFKNQGNDCFREGKPKYKDAVDYYTKAIETDCSDKKLMEACYANRAAVNLELGNLGRAIRDCAKCLELNPTNVKALYRSARALFALDRLDEAYDCCEHALATDPNNTAVQALKSQCAKRRDMLIARQRAEEEKAQKEKESKEGLESALKARNIRIQVVDEDVRKSANIVYDASNDTLSWPVFFLYPEHKESDYIQSFNETNTFMDHLEVILEQPAPWDTTHTYTPDNVEVYFENNQGIKPSLIKIGKKHTLGKILSLDQYVVQNGVPSFIILPKNSAFKDEFLQKYKK